MTDFFHISRSNGKSNAQVVIEHVSGKSPGTIFTFDELKKVLSKDTDRKYDRNAIRQIAMQCNPRLLKEHQRALHSVRTVGYRLAEAKDHQPLSLVRKRRSDVQLKRGLELLRHVKWDEMDENNRNAHMGTLSILEGLYAAQTGYERRQNAIMDAIQSLRRDVDELKS
jgi:hypothetical protein